MPCPKVFPIHSSHAKIYRDIYIYMYSSLLKRPTNTRVYNTHETILVLLCGPWLWTFSLSKSFKKHAQRNTTAAKHVKLSQSHVHTDTYIHTSQADTIKHTNTYERCLLAIVSWIHQSSNITYITHTTHSCASNIHHVCYSNLVWLLGAVFLVVVVNSFQSMQNT